MIERFLLNITQIDMFKRAQWLGSFARKHFNGYDPFLVTEYRVQEFRKTLMFQEFKTTQQLGLYSNNYELRTYIKDRKVQVQVAK